MTSIRMALTELIRLSSGRLPRIALLAMALIPTLYGGLYLYANHDPYGGLDRVPAALVVQDTGSTMTDGSPVHAGRDVARDLRAAGDFDWHEVDAAQAARGIHDGTYDFGLTIPKDFSAALTSSARFDPRRARLKMTTNDANSYLSTTIADTVTGKVRDALAQRVGSEAARQFLVGLGRIRGSLSDAAHGADQLTDGLGSAVSGSKDLTSGARRLATAAQRLSGGLGTLAAKTAPLPAQTRRLAAGAREVSAGDRKVAGVGDRVARVSRRVRHAYAGHRSRLAHRMDQLGLTAEQKRRLLEVYDDLGTPVRDADAKVQQAHRKLDRLSGGAARVAAGNAQLAAATPALVRGIEEARHGATRIGSGAGRLQSGAARLHRGLVRVHHGSDRLATGLRDGLKQVPAVGERTRDRLATTLGNPVRISSAAQTSAGSYGAGLAPFFCALAAWIGGYVLFLLVRPLSQRAMAANQAPVRVAVAGWLTPAALGVVQMVLLLGVVLLGVHLHVANLPGTLLFLLAMSAAFIAIVHALNAWFGAAGQFLGLVMMVLQLVTAGGTFPWQTIPEPLHALHHVLPMSYAVDGLRQLMYGGMSALVTRDLLVLLGWFLVALLATSLAARRQRVWSVKRIKPELSL